MEVLWLILPMLQDLKVDPKDEFLSLLRATVKCLTRPEKYFEKVIGLEINYYQDVGVVGLH
ncbi:hypothetical protein GYH30_033562 [Glycine max]|uniref:Uncharacterized protein n=2 Tax=Glycine subgen. Soja TaxID=1462606 RepID=A0A0R0H5B4_SOYBN|nr:hypothetical protein JHK87_033531 [Glycine soja]KAH1142902.1 hypothetical protein GYH30_033562 [Glycine max]RZB75592.1 hypothetical protein D0Y65_034180 [Glycine soja]